MRRISVALLVPTVLMTAPAASFAQGLPSDPEADSPSGVVYELPVDRARKDAAPRRGTARDGSGGPADSSGSASNGSEAVGDTTATSIRSENNFGTSSEVPGAPSRRKGPGSGSRDGTGGSRGGAGDAVKRVAGVASSPAAAEGPSDGVVFPLLAALLAVGAGIGVVAGRRSLRNRRGE